MSGNTVGGPNNVLTPEQLAEAKGVLAKVFQAVMDFIYTLLSTLINFFTQPEVLGALVMIAIFYGAYYLWKRKRLS